MSAAKSMTFVLFCILFAARGSAQDKLVFAVDIIRHGDRTPTIQLPGTSPALWPEGLGKLTALGTNQEFSLGSRMRSLYTNAGLLGSNDLPGTLCVFSTDKERTRARAQIFLRGLLAESNPPTPILTQIPINIEAALSKPNLISAGQLLIPNDRRDFPALLSQYVLHAPEWLSTNIIFQPQLDHWSRALNSNIVNIHDLIIPADALYIHQLHHVPLPDGLSPDEVNTIIKAGRWAFVYQYQAEVGQITGRPLLKKIAEYLNNASHEKILRKTNPLKYVLFSAHDSTLLSEMSALRSPLTDGHVPPYAALLHFALFETSRTNFYVQVTYHDDADHIVPNPTRSDASWSLKEIKSCADYSGSAIERGSSFPEFRPR
jgi:acid phosphatase